MDIDLIIKIIIAILAYLLGAFPTAYVIYRVRRGDDIRKYGSGNVGGTNLTRTLGASFGISTIFIDMIKGFLPVLAVYLLYPEDIIFLSIVAGIVVVGHDFPVYIGFKGGKGIATTYGVIVGLSCLPFIAGPVWLRIIPAFTILGIWAIGFLIFKIVSIGSLVAAISIPLSFYFTKYPWPVIIVGACLGILIFITHRDNLKRLIRGEEKKLKKKKGA